MYILHLESEIENRTLMLSNYPHPRFPCADGNYFDPVSRLQESIKVR